MSYVLEQLAEQLSKFKAVSEDETPLSFVKSRQ